MASSIRSPRSVFRGPAIAILRSILALVLTRGFLLPASPVPADDWWAIQPLPRRDRPGTPVAPPLTSAAHPIDALVAGIDPQEGRRAPEPDRRTLLRRLMVDLHGLLPTPEEVEAFEQDPASHAFERQVDRLLASPRYGERWARHWLDVVHFAETHGHDQDRPRDHAWPYRDYLIEAFNQDRPYDRFVQEQVAADALFPDEPRLLPALGFLAAGPWDESSLRDIREDTLDREIGRYLDRDDIVANVMSTFTSVTVHCARCHDHKFDPVPQADYYALQAVFAGTEKAERVYDDDPAINRQRLFWMRLQTALDRRDAVQLQALLTPALRAEQEAWEAGTRRQDVRWLPLLGLPESPASPTTLESLPDGSWRVSGPNPPTNTYTLTLPIPPGMGLVTAVRLEVLPDASLPGQGPGRAENGNFHLTGIEILATESPGGGTAPEAYRRLPIAAASATFNQEGWDIGKALDADPGSGWGIHPREGQEHAAVFELSEALTTEPGTRLQVVLRQDHGRQHTLGHFRLSATGAPPPVRAAGVPASILALLERPPDSRDPGQRLEVTARFLEGRIARELARLPEPRRVFAGTAVFPVNGGQKPLTRPRPVHVLRRGEITKPGDPASPGALTCLEPLPARFSTSTPPDSPGADEDRRAQLARWLSHPDNPLVWRSIVNRVWQYHFGRGIVATPNDFGRMGSRPAAPALLDDLAVRFRDDLGGSLKRLHRLILTSRTWRSRAAPPETAGPLQPLVQRLDAETFRDSLLRMSGRLDDRQGGPSQRLFAMSPGIHVTPNVDYAAFDPDGPGSGRRSIYRFLFRTLPDPLMATLDCPAGDQSAPVRGESFTALQAFALLNHPFILRQCQHLAADIRRAHPDPDIPGQVDEACRRVWLRSPGEAERTALLAHARDHGLPHLCRLLLNSDELHFVD